MRRKRRLHPKKRKPPFTIAAAVVGIAAAGYGAYASSKKGGAGSASSTSQQEYPKETTALFGDVEKPMLERSMQDQNALLTPFISGSPYSDFLMQQYGKSSGSMASGAVKAGGKSAGISDTGGAQLDLEGLPPVLVNALKQLAFQNAAQRTTAVPAGYGNFLAPSQSTKSESSSGGDPAGTGFQLASSIANIGAAYYNANKVA